MVDAMAMASLQLEIALEVVVKRHVLMPYLTKIARRQIKPDWRW